MRTSGGALFGAILALFLAVAAPTSDAQECPKGKVRLYASATMQGAMLPLGAGMRNGIDMAVAEAGGAAGGYCLEVVHLDNASAQTGAWDAAVEAENARRAAADPLAVVYIGPYQSEAAKISITITNRAQMAQISPAATYPGLTKRPGTAASGEPWSYRPLGLVNFFRPLSADDVQGALGARWARSLGAKTVFVLSDDEAYGRGIATVFEVTAKRLGLAVVANEDIDGKRPDQKPVIAKIAASGADLVYMGGTADTGAQTILRDMKEAGLVAPRVRFMGPDGLVVDELLSGAICDAAVATDARVTFPGRPVEKMTAAGARTYAAYKTAFGKEPAAFSLYAVEATRVAIDGIRRASPDLERATNPAERREAVRKAIAATRNFDGINATWSFDANGDVDTPVVSGFRVVKADGARCAFRLEDSF